MAQGQTPQMMPIQTMTMIASEAITLYAAVKGTASTEGYISLADSDSMALGVALNAAAANEEVTVAIRGIVYAVANAVVAVYSMVHPVAATGYVDDTNVAAAYYLGVALTAATAQGNWIAVHLTPGSLYAAT